MQTLAGPFRIEADGFAFTECPRWHDGQFYFSDVEGKKVCRLVRSGEVETLLELADNPSGLGPSCAGVSFTFSALIRNCSKAPSPFPLICCASISKTA
jgi:hypothetical protein